uniref:Uncharacterized protein n=1 Tax=Physcomitrium patens TaxID=3218 RepID=A0A7I3ZWT7_PHYPA
MKRSSRLKIRRCGVGLSCAIVLCGRQQLRLPRRDTESEARGHGDGAGLATWHRLAGPASPRSRPHSGLGTCSLRSLTAPKLPCWGLPSCSVKSPEIICKPHSHVNYFLYKKKEKLNNKDSVLLEFYLLDLF